MEIAAFASARSDVLFAAGRIADAPLERFLGCGRSLVASWTATLDEYRAVLPTLESIMDGEEVSEYWSELADFFEEVFVSELLFRVWGAVLTAADQESGQVRGEPIARRVLIDTLFVRRDALAIIADSDFQSHPELLRCEKVRRKVERWSDVLIGHLTLRYDVNDFAFSAERCRDFGIEQLEQEVLDSRSAVWEMILTGLRLAFPSTQAMFSPTSDDHRRLISSILTAFPPAAFDVPRTPLPKLFQRIAESSRMEERAPFSK